MKHLYRFLLFAALLMSQAFAQSTSSCTVSLSFKDSISYSPFAHYVTFKASAGQTDHRLIKKVCWKFGDGTVECREATPGTSGEALLTITHKYGPTTTPLMVYNVCVTVSFDGGCVAEKCISIYLQSPNTSTCAVGLRSEPLNSAGNALFFAALPEHSSQKKPVEICWRFGDGSETVCKQYAATYTGTYTINHQFANPGRYEVCAIVKFEGGCETKKCMVITVPGTVSATCSAGIRTEPISSNNLVRRIAALPEHSQGKKPLQVCWKFGDGSAPLCKTYAATYTGSYVAEHAFPRAGQYEVCVNIKYDGGCEAHKCILLTVGTATPTCALEIKTETLANHPGVKKIFVLPKHSAQKKPVEVCWKFGDGSETVCRQYAATYTGTYVAEHNFAAPGRYEVCAEVKYEDGCTARNCTVVVISPPPTVCEAKLYEAAASLHQTERKFYLGLMNDRRPEKICWSFGDDTEVKCITLSNTADHNVLTATHEFPGPGVYRVCARVWYTGGCVVEKCLEVVIRPQVPAVCGGYMTHTPAGLKTVLFKGFSISSNRDEAVSYSWSFGDGTTATGKEVKHEFAATGSYEVCLSIKTASGCETKICKKLTVETESRPRLILSPNPATISLHAQFFSTRAETVNIRIFNANGLLVKTFSRAAVAGENNWTFEVGTLPIGVYSVVVQSNYQFATAIFFKQ